MEEVHEGVRRDKVTASVRYINQARRAIILSIDYEASYDMLGGDQSELNYASCGMRIGCILPVRGEPLKAVAGIEIARELASGNHEIQYVIACDDDDHATIDKLRILSSATHIYVGPRPLGCGDFWNRPTTAFSGGPMDIYVPLYQDAFITAPNWDDVVVGTIPNIQPQGYGLIAGNDPSVPGTASAVIFSKGWVELTGRLYPNYFPFWFIDTWVDETYSFVTGKTIPIVNNLTFTGKRGKTRRLRDLQFWWDYFTALRPQREADAAAIRTRLQINLEPDQILRARKHWENRDASNRGLLKQFEAAQGYDNAPTESYKLAKAKAEAHLASLGQAATVKPEDISALNKQGLEFYEQRRFEDALATFEKIIVINPNDPGLHYNRATILGDLNRFDEALAAYDRVIALKPDFVFALNNRGWILQKLRRYDEAVASYNKALAIDPTYTAARENREQLLHAQTQTVR